MMDISWQSLNWFDCAILVILGLSIIVSILRGFVRELLSVIVWVLAIIAALKFALPASANLQTLITTPLLRYIIAFIVILFVVLIVGMIVNGLIRRMMQKSSLGILDRLLGFYFGFGRGVLLVALVLLLLRVSSLQNSPMVKNSVLAPEFNGVVTWLNDFLPQEIQSISKWTKTSVADLMNSSERQLGSADQSFTNSVTSTAQDLAGKVGY